MAVTQVDIQVKETNLGTETQAVDLVESIPKVTIENVGVQPDSQDDLKPKNGLEASPRLAIIYTRPQLISLQNSPLVQPPPNMPQLKDWFGYFDFAHAMAFILNLPFQGQRMNKTFTGKRPNPLTPQVHGTDGIYV